MGETTPFRGESSSLETGERVVDLARLPIERQFLEQFPDNLRLQKLHLYMAIGIEARTVRNSYALGSSEKSLLVNETNPTHYGQLLEAVHSVHDIREETIVDAWNREALWGGFYDAITELNPQLAGSHLPRHLERVRNQHAKFRENVENEDAARFSLRDIESIRIHQRQIRSISEYIVTKELGAVDQEVLAQRSRELDQPTWDLFSESQAWLTDNNPIEYFKDTLGDDYLIILQNVRNHSLARKEANST
ncbi:MAG: hypothetical protein U5L95_04315 [Candidatus Saccharibacteria bacterium]|nr:hypothetical protein [Candidatus Saccharibacteria bacterium]